MRNTLILFDQSRVTKYAHLPRAQRLFNDPCGARLAYV